MAERLKITVAGMGYVGLSLAVLLSQNNDVTVVDIVPERIDKLNRWESPIGDELIAKYLAEHEERKLSLRATSDPIPAYAEADFIIIATPTDYDPNTNKFDCSTVEAVLELIRQASSDSDKKPVVVIKSTVPEGFTLHIREKLCMDNIIFSPEFLRESKALYDNLYPSRIVVGTEDINLAAARTFASLLRKAAQNDPPVVIMHIAEAEAVKLFANTYLALRVSFFNELDSFAELRGLDTAQIIRGISLDPRIGDYYNNPSFGYGGYCLPKDTKQMLANYSGVPQNLISAVVESNATRKSFIARRVMERAAQNSAQDGRASEQDPPVIGIYRLTMKTGSDNFHQASIRDVMLMLREEGASVVVYEPALKDEKEYHGFPVVSDLALFKRMCACIVANRYDAILDDVKSKVYTRDLFRRD